MIVHLQCNHRAEYMKVKSMTAQPGRSSSSSSQTSSKQPCIIESFELLQPLPWSSKRWKILINSVCQYTAKDMIPLSTVNNVGFQKMLNTFEPYYVLPDRKAITHHYMPEMYKQK